jgi:hypothetical protein
MDQYAGKHNNCVFICADGSGAPPGLEYDTKNKGVHQEHDKRSNERPEESEKRAFIAAQNLAASQLKN